MKLTEDQKDLVREGMRLTRTSREISTAAGITTLDLLEFLLEEASKGKQEHEGFLHYDKNDGWCLDGEDPKDGCRIKDLFHDFDGKQVRVTIEVVEDLGEEERG